MRDTSIVLHPLRAEGVISRGRSVFACDSTGFVDGAGETGLWVSETRLLSRQRWLVDRVVPTLITASKVHQHLALAYFITVPPGQPGGDSAQKTLELRLTRSVGEGLCEDVAVENHTQRETSFMLTLEIDADFADWAEAAGGERYVRRLARRMSDGNAHPGLCLECRAEYTRNERGAA